MLTSLPGREQAPTRTTPPASFWSNNRLQLIVSAALLLLSVILFVRAWWGHWFFMAILSGGGVVIVGCWLRLRDSVSPLNLLPAAALFFYNSEVAGGLVPFLTANKTAATYDGYLAFVDRSFGFFPSLLVCNWVARVPHLNEFFFGVYMALSFAMGICYAAHMRQSRPPWNIAIVLTVTATIGVLSYNLLPACGPLMLFGVQGFLHGNPFSSFPGDYPTIVNIALKYPRNAMPSLHMTWALLVLWICRDLKLGHKLAVVFALFTAIATLSTGEHYLVDLVVAFPFALAIWKLFIGDVPLFHPKRTLAIAGAACVCLAWITAIRYYPGFFYASPLIPWGFSLATVLGTVAMVYSQPATSFMDSSVVTHLPAPKRRSLRPRK